MSNYPTLDREAFQMFLASAFAVQQSQMDSESLSAIIEVGRSIRSGELDVDAAVDLIVERTRTTANITGGTINLLSSGVQPPLPELDEHDRVSGILLSHLASTLAGPGTEGASADLALDLALNDIAEQARLATNASVAAIALMRGEEMVCRATSGTSASEFGELLNARAGPSSECIQTKQALCCTDTELDVRFDGDVCRPLGIHSWIVCPVLKQDKLVGLLAIFYSRPKAFGDVDIQTLQTFSHQVLINVNCAAELSTPAVPDEPFTRVDDGNNAADNGNNSNNNDARSASFQEHATDAKAAQVQRSDSWTLSLVVMAIVMSIVLGWMLGRVRELATAPKHQKSASTQVSIRPQLPPQPTGTRPKLSPPPSDSQKAKVPQTPSDGLVVYQGGKVIFKLKPSQAHGEWSAPDAGQTSPGKANVRVLQRVEPEYPEAAKQQHIQGTVVLNAKVGEDGAVRQLAVISGDPMLATAATDAVFKWRFEPLVQKGRAAPFQTRVKVDFVLP